MTVKRNQEKYKKIQILIKREIRVAKQNWMRENRIGNPYIE